MPAPTSELPDASVGSVKPPPPQAVVKDNTKKQTSEPAAIPQAVNETWHIKDGKLKGAHAGPSGKVLSKIKNKKSNGFTSEVCFDYGAFGILETKSTDEVGSAELYVRHKPEGKSICAKDFKGEQKNLKLREGSFAGVVGGIEGFVVTEGSDASEYLLESQIFNVMSGEEIVRVIHDPAQEYKLDWNGKVLSAIFHSKISVKCELPTEAQVCWKQVIKDNKLPISIKMPDCKPAFAKANKKLEEPALVTVKSRIRDVRKPKIEFMPGNANCVPEP